MDPHDLNSSEEQPREPLEALLREAAWPEPGPETLARLRQCWFDLSPAQARPARTRFRRGMALAAMLACLATGGLLWHAAHSQREPQLAAPAPPAAPGPPPAIRLAHEELESNATGLGERKPPGNGRWERSDEAPEVAAVRDPNAYESLLFCAGQRRRALARQQPDDRFVADAVGQLLADPSSDPRTAAAPLIPRRASAEPRLATMAQQARGEEQLAAIRLLGIVGTHRSIPILLELKQHATAHEAAVRSLAALADSELLGRLAAAEQNPLLRRELLASLLTRGDVPSVAVFLCFVEDGSWDPLALAVAAERSTLPLEELLGFLRGPQPSRRMAAARVLGRIDDPRIPQRLIQMVLENVYRQESLVALLSSPRREASEFLAGARRDPLLVASVQAAHYQFANLP